jgi:hypothetical protein
MAVLSTQIQLTAHRSPARTTGWFLVAAALAFVLYLALAATAGADYEAEIRDASKAAGTSIERIPPAENARIVQEYDAYSVVSGLVIMMPVALLFAALHFGRRAFSATLGAPYVEAAWWSILGATVLWHAYMVLNGALSFFAPDHLPPLVRDLDVITVPLFDLMSVFALGGLIALGLAARKDRIAPKTALACVILAAFIMIAGNALSLAGGLDSSLPPPAWVPVALVLGIGLLRSRTPAHGEQP